MIVPNVNFKAALAKQLTKYSTKMARPRELLLTGDIDGIDYKEIKQDCKRNRSSIEARLEDADKKNYSQEKLISVIDKVITTFTRLSAIYLNQALKKRESELVRCSLKNSLLKILKIEPQNCLMSLNVFTRFPRR